MEARSDGPVGKALVLHTVDPGLIPGVPYSSQSTPGVIPNHRGVSPKENKKSLSGKPNTFIIYFLLKKIGVLGLGRSLRGLEHFPGMLEHPLPIPDTACCGPVSPSAAGIAALHPWV